MTGPTVQWLVKARALPDLVIPVHNEAAAIELMATLRRTAASHRQRVAFEYGTHDPAVPHSYRKVGP